jgi:hypothetical protein
LIHDVTARRRVANSRKKERQLRFQYTSHRRSFNLRWKYDYIGGGARNKSMCVALLGKH